MHRKRLRLSLLLLTVALMSVWMVLPVSAQTEEPNETAEIETDVEPCAFDLTALRSLLDEAQSLFDTGDEEEAVALLGDASAEIDAVRFECQPIPDLIETSIGNVLTLGVPEDWTSSAEDDDASDGSLTFITATDLAALEASSNSVPQLVADQQVIGVLYAGGNAIDALVETDGEVTLDSVVQSLIDDLDNENDGLLSEPEALTVEDWRAQNFRLSLDGSEATAYVVEVERRASYVIIIGLGANGALDRVDAVTRAVVDTLQYTPPVAP